VLLVDVDENAEMALVDWAGVARFLLERPTADVGQHGDLRTAYELAKTGAGGTARGRPVCMPIVRCGRWRRSGRRQECGQSIRCCTQCKG
jgi:hypothetical protein